MKKTKIASNVHTAKTKFGMGDFYGSGITNKVGKIRSTFDPTAIPSKNMGKPPKAVA